MGTFVPITLCQAEGVDNVVTMGEFIAQHSEIY